MTQYTNDDLLQELHDLADQLGRTPVSREMESEGAYSENVYRERFGTWNDALREAGLPVANPAPSQVSRKGLIDAVHSLAKQLGRTPSGPEMDEHGKHTTPTYVNRFGGWADVVMEAGYIPRRSSEDALIRRVRRLADEQDGCVKPSDVREAYPVEAFRQEGMAPKHAVEQAGYDPNTGDPLSDNMLLAMLVETIELVGLNAERDEYAERNPIHPIVYEERFGGENTDGFSAAISQIRQPAPEQ